MPNPGPRPLHNLYKPTTYTRTCAVHPSTHLDWTNLDQTHGHNDSGIF